MLGSIRKFSTTIYAKILLGIIIIPFIFWGMGGSLSGGNKNVIVKIENEKYSKQEFADFIRKTSPLNKKIGSEDIERFLSSFIGEKIIEKEVENLNIKLSDDSLSKIIKSHKDFKRDNKFSRIEYEKFLLKNNITAMMFENRLFDQEKKKQLFDFISGGIIPSKFLVNQTYNRFNQKRNVDLINLNIFLEKQFKFSPEEIQSQFEIDKSKYSQIYKSVRLIELSPKNLVGIDEFNDSFFKKIDEIDYLIIEGHDLDHIAKKYNLTKINLSTLNESGEGLDGKEIDKIIKKLKNKIFNLSSGEETALIENEKKYFIVQIDKTKNIQKNINDNSVKKQVLLELEKKSKRKFLSNLISKINNNSFSRFEFEKMSKEKNIPIKKIILNNQNDDKNLKKEIIKEIYAFPEKKIIVVHDVNFNENFLVYIDKVTNVSIEEKSEEYKNYEDLSKMEIVRDLYTSYDNYIKQRYKIHYNQ